MKKAIDILNRELENSASGFTALVVHPDFMDRLMIEIPGMLLKSQGISGYQYVHRYAERITEIEYKEKTSLLTIYVSSDNLRHNEIVLI